MGFRRAWRIVKLQAHLREGGGQDCEVAGESWAVAGELDGIAKLRERAGRFWEGARGRSEVGGEELRQSPSGAMPSCRNSKIKICSSHIPYSHDLCSSSPIVHAFLS